MSRRDLIHTHEICFNEDEAMKKLKKEDDDVRPESSQVPSRFNNIPHFEYFRNHGYLEINLPDDGFITHDDHDFLLGWKRFDVSMEVSLEAYKTMKPALALAHRFLHSDRYFPWWTRVLYGTLGLDATSDRQRLYRNEREDKVQQAKEDLLVRWQSLSKDLRFYWCPRKPINAANEGWARTHTEERTALFDLGAISKAEWRASARGSDENGEPPPIQTRIGLSTIFLYHLTSPVARHGRTRCEEMRLHFYLAITIVHELAHAFLKTRRLKKEPFVFPNDPTPDPEVGFSWENWAFGVEFTWNRGLSRVGPLFSTEFKTFDTRSQIKTPVPMEWIRDIFLEETWANIEQAMLEGKLKAPRPTGHPKVFIAQRTVQGKHTSVLYEAQAYRIVSGEADGKVPPVEQPIEEWFADVLREDDAQAEVDVKDESSNEPKEETDPCNCGSSFCMVNQLGNHDSC